LQNGTKISHYLNLIDGRYIDLASQQFVDGTIFTDPMPKKKSFSSTREYCLSNENTNNRYKILKTKFAKYIYYGLPRQITNYQFQCHTSIFYGCMTKSFILKIMNKQEIIEIQKRILDLVPNKSGIYLKYCCSEISRLIIKWLWDYNKSYKFYILKGFCVMGGKMSHDILAIEEDNGYLIIDPTIWQFFPDASTILVYEGSSLDAGIDKIKNKYNCTWVLEKQEKVPSTLEQKKQLEIINSNINDNIKEFI